MVVPLPAELNEEVISDILEDVLDKVKRQTVTGIVIELSAVSMVDSVMFSALRDAVRTLKLLGATTILCGFQPGVVSSLVDLNVEVDDITTSRTVEDALAQLKTTCPAGELAKQESDELESTSEDIIVEKYNVGSDGDPIGEGR